MDLSAIHPSDFLYHLPEGKIAKYPLSDRASSKLLHYQKGKITHHLFSKLPDLVPPNSLLVLNDTRVISARLIFHRATGARIEVFLLEPVQPSPSMEVVMNSVGSCTWKCMIGNAKKWKADEVISSGNEHFQILAKRLSDDEVELTWEKQLTFSELLEKLGRTPLPPYINREVEISDLERYQTVYSKHDGAVAAPTAGLHFTENLIDELKQKSRMANVTLHVSAGTFQPIKTSASDHPMHREQIVVSRSLIHELLNFSYTIAVGTTSLRTLESLYWYGVKLGLGESKFQVEKTYPYQHTNPLPTLNESLGKVLAHLDCLNADELHGYTEIFIVPGYDFKVCKGLITNFHLPETTLMMLVGAFVGEGWKKIYAEALANNYRFLSYGDSSFLQRA